MSKSKQPKHSPGIHLFKTDPSAWHAADRPEWYWRIVSRNGRIIARSSETYTRKGNAVKSIMAAAMIFMHKYHVNGATYYDHSQPDSHLKSYL